MSAIYRRVFLQLNSSVCMLWGFLWHVQRVYEVLADLDHRRLYDATGVYSAALHVSMIKKFQKRKNKSASKSARRRDGTQVYAAFRPVGTLTKTPGRSHPCTRTPHALTLRVHAQEGRRTKVAMCLAPCLMVWSLESSMRIFARCTSKSPTTTLSPMPMNTEGKNPKRPTFANSMR